MEHWSDCAVHNEPAYMASPCDCGGVTLASKLHAWLYRLAYNLASASGLFHLKAVFRMFRLSEKAATAEVCRSDSLQQSAKSA